MKGYDLMKHIGEYIKQIRLEKNLSQKNVTSHFSKLTKATFADVLWQRR